MITLITGTSSGIGLATSVALAKAGHTVIATMRNTGKSGPLEDAAAAAGVQVHIAPLDVTDPEAILATVVAVIAEHGRLDVLINNAGAPYVGTLEQISDEDLDWMMNLNFTGVARLTRAALPHMRAQGGGRIVTVTSVGGVLGQPFNDVYCAAKFAVEGLMQSLHPIASAHGIHVSVVEPGAVATEFVANAGSSLTEREGAEDAYSTQLANYLERTAGAYDAAQTPDELAAVIRDVVDSDAPAFRYQTSERSTMIAGMSLSDLDGSVVTSATSTWVN